MTVLIAAAGKRGEAAEKALQERDVIHVDSAEAAIEALSDASVVAVAELAQGSPAEVRTAARAAGVPVVSISERSPESQDEIDELRENVALAQHVFEYRDAVDDFYERCRAHAENDADVDLQTASNRAHTRFRELRDVAGYTPYERVLDDPPLNSRQTGSAADADADTDQETETGAQTGAETDTENGAETKTGADSNHAADIDDSRSNRDDDGRD